MTDGKRVLRAVGGALIAGGAMSTVMLAGEALTGKPSELIELKRAAATKLGIQRPVSDAPANVAEQLVTHGGHLALSALAGAAYAAVVDEDTDSVATGACFGFAFYIIAYGLLGPLLGVTPAPWREQPLRSVQHPIVHVLFGLTTALFARGGRLSRWR